MFAPMLCKALGSTKMTESEDSVHTYQIRPKYDNKFRPGTAKEHIRNVLNEELSGKMYDSSEAGQLTKHIADVIKAKLKELCYDRYKFVVQVVIGEQRGEGVKIGSRCLWDSATDNYASDVYRNDSLFCVATAFGVYYY